MANITLTIPDAQVSRVINALCGGVNVSIIIPPSIDPNTGALIVTAAAAKAALISLVKEVVTQAETIAAQKSIVPPDVA